MLFYYGNSYSEALANEPIELKTIEDYQEYENCYSVLIPIE